MLYPKTIEKVNVRLALSVLHKSTISGLKHYGYSDTATVLELFLKFWTILNVLSPISGKHKLNILRDAVKSPHDWKLEFLVDFGSYVSDWENSSVSDFNTIDN